MFTELCQLLCTWKEGEITRLTEHSHMRINESKSNAGAAATCLLPLLALLSCGEPSPDSTVERHLKTFFSAYAGRDLSDAELRETTREFIQLHTEDGRARDAIRDIAGQLGSYAKVLRDRDSPAAFSARHALLESNYFNPDLHGSIEQRLFTEPDPVRVVDVRSKRLMTQQDVIALANLRHFATSDDAPRHRSLSPQQVDELVAALSATFGGNSGRMPRFFGEAAAFWHGVQQEWPRLSADQRNLVRSYAGKLWRIQMPVEMYRRLWGLESQAASNRHADDVSARLSAITDLNIQLGNLAPLMDALFKD